MQSEALQPVQPLEGVVVVDISRLAIPYASHLLTDMGATTIAIKPPDGVSSKIDGAYHPDIRSNDSPTWRNKLHLEANLKTAAGQALLHRLVEKADVFIEGFRPGVVGRLGCDYATLAAFNPRLVYCSITGFGQTGPLAQRPGHDLNYISLPGAQSLVGTVSGEYAIPMNILADFAGGGMYAALTICAALRRQALSGTGAYLDIAMTDGVATLIGGSLSGAERGASVPERGGGLLGGGAPFYRIYSCADGLPLSVACIERQFWVDLCRHTGQEALLEAQRDEVRWPEMCRTFEQVFAGRTRGAWLQAAAAFDVCMAPVNSPAEAMREPQLTERRLDGVFGGGRVQSSHTGGSAGRDDARVLREHGYGEDLLAVLCELHA